MKLVIRATRYFDVFFVLTYPVLFVLCRRRFLCRWKWNVCLGEKYSSAAIEVAVLVRSFVYEKIPSLISSKLQKKEETLQG